MPNSRKVWVNVSVSLLMRVDEGVDMDDVMANLDYGFSLIREGAEVADIEDMYIEDWNVTSSK